MCVHCTCILPEKLSEEAERYELGMSDDDNENDTNDFTNILENGSSNLSGLTSFNRTRWCCFLKTSRSHLDNFGE